MKRVNKRSIFVVPFGRYPFGSALSGGLAFVGRESQRAKLIRRLLDARERTSILVTGRRGAGKTTFVEHCLAEYEGALFRRLLRAEHGRSTADLIVGMLVIILFAFVMIVVADAIQLLSPLARDGGLIGLLLVPFLLIGVLPLLLAWQIIRDVTQVRIENPVARLAIASIVYLAIIGFVFFGTALCDFVFKNTSLGSWSVTDAIGMVSAAPTLALSRALLAVGLLAFSGELVQIGYADVSWRRIANYSKIGRHICRGKQAYPDSIWLRWMFYQLMGPFLVFKWAARTALRLFLPLSAVLYGSLSGPIAWINFQAFRIEKLIQPWWEYFFGSPDIVNKPIYQPLAYLGTNPGTSSSDEILNNLFFFFVAFSLMVAIKGARALFQSLQAKAAGSAGTGNGAVRREFFRKFQIHLITLVILIVALTQIEKAVDLIMPTFGLPQPKIQQDQIAVLVILVPTAIYLFFGLSFLVSQRLKKSKRPSIQRLIARTEGISLPVTFCGYFKALVLALLGLHILYGAQGLISAPIEKYSDDAFARSMCDALSNGQNKTEMLTPIEGDFAWSEKMGRPVNEGSSAALLGPDFSPFRSSNAVFPSTEPPMAVPLASRIFAFQRAVGTNVSYLNNERPPFDQLTWSDTARQVCEVWWPVFKPGVGSIPRDEQPTYFTLFGAPLEEIGWMVHLVLLAGVFFFLDYEWINRPGTALSDTRALEPSTRRHWRPKFAFDPANHLIPWSMLSDHRGVFRTEYERMERYRRGNAAIQERTTLPFYLAKFWLKSIVVRINLGFEQLEHRGIILSMLNELRTSYRKQFMGYRSPHGGLTLLTVFVLTAMAVTFLGKSFFDLPSIKSETSDAVYFDKPENDPGKLAPRIAYCKLLADNSTNDGHTTAGVPRTFCMIAPGLTQTFMPILYASIIDLDISSESIMNRFIFSVFHKNRGLPSLERIKHSNDWRLTENTEGASLRVYHLLLFIAVIVAWRQLSILLRLTPYRAVMRRFDHLIDLLMTEGRISKRRAPGESGFFLAKYFFVEQTSETSREQLDPRTVEAMLIDILETMQKSRLTLPFDRFLRITIPAPEITFVFDELDKVSGIVRQSAPNLAETKEDIAALDAERRRTYALRDLLSDMKRVIASSKARFIFVGNRLLHDEWIADHTRRTPLLTSIFDEEVYLPSLLVDKGSVISPLSNSQSFRPQDRIWEYLSRLHHKSDELYRKTLRMRLSPFYGRSRFKQQNDFSYDDHYVDAQQERGGLRYIYNEQSLDRLAHQISDRNQDEIMDVFLPVLRAQDGLSIDNVCWGENHVHVDPTWRRHFANSLVDYLTFRSLGNPKKLQQLFSQFVVSASRVAPPPADLFDPHQNPSDFTQIRDSRLPVDDALVFEPDQIYRLQLVSSLFRHVTTSSFANRLGQKNDRLIISVIYLYEFFLKFHGRGFSWSSLERVEELAHIHRSPELRRVMTTIVHSVSERYLHRVLNGMYGYRFRSDLSVEMRRVSRKFETEQAAFNFTLDESQTLKATYVAQLAQSKTSNLDVISGLGELYEFDQEFETARHHYRHAIRLNDEYFFYYNGKSYEPQDALIEEAKKLTATYLSENSGADTTELLSKWLLAITANAPQTPIATLRGIMDGEPISRELIGTYSPWGGRRLRLMLRIGLTYEMSQDLEMAELHYRDAKRLAFSLMEAFLPRDDNEADGGNNNAASNDQANQLLENINLFYQPLFAEAWAVQKLPSGLDTPVSIVDHGIALFRSKLPILKDLELTRLPSTLTDISNAESRARIENAANNQQFAMIGAEIHNKAGDLFFFKGRTFVPCRALKDIVKSGKNADGFILVAHRHYATALHEIRRFNFIRRVTSAWKLQIANPGALIGSDRETLRRGDWPDFVSLAIVNNLTDLADAAISRTSLISILNDLGQKNKEAETLIDCDPADSIKLFQEALTDFLEASDTGANRKLDYHISSQICLKPSSWWINNAALLGQFLGKWEQSGGNPVAFDAASSHTARLYFALHMAHAAAKLTEQSGYKTNAASEHLFAAELAIVYLLRLRVLNVVSIAESEDGLQRSAICDLLGDICKSNSNSPQMKLTPAQQKLGLFLLKHAVFNLQAYSKLAQASARREDKDYRIGSVIDPAAVTLLCSAILQASGLFATEIDNEAPQGEKRQLLKKLFVLADNWFSESHSAALLVGIEDDLVERVENVVTPDAAPLETLRALYGSEVMPSFSERQAWPENDWSPQLRISESYGLAARALLNYCLTRHPYPALNQVSGLKVLIDDACLATPTANRGEGDLRHWTLKRAAAIRSKIEELSNLEEELDAPMHVTSMKVAGAATLWWIRVSDNQFRPNEEKAILETKITDSLENIRQRARHRLKQSQETYTMGPRFRSSISGLHYLFDDFNDRRLHINHAFQMSGMELCAIFQEILKD